MGLPAADAAALARKGLGVVALPRQAPEPSKRLRARLRTLAPARLGRALRQIRAAARAAAIGAVPLPLYEVWKLRSLDPFVPRAATVSYRTSGKHILILAATPMTDSGGGQRAAQLAQELLTRTHRVTYVYLFPSRERSRRPSGFAHENLTHVRFSDFSARAFAIERGLRERMIVLCELPAAELCASARFLKSKGAQLVYDCTDDWDSPLGGRWYSRRAEDTLLEGSDVIMAPGRAIKDALEARSWRNVALVPNAANTHLFARGREHPRPVDLPQTGPIFLYVGTLSGYRFNWDWAMALARARPDAAVVLVGDDHGQRPDAPPNVHLLGLRPLQEVPAYVAHADVCLAPFRGDSRARVVGPSTLYESLAMGKPVVASGIPDLQDLPFVTIARSERELVEAVVRAQSLKPIPTEVARFAAQNGWKARVRLIERLLGIEPCDGSPERAFRIQAP